MYLVVLLCHTFKAIQAKLPDTWKSRISSDKRKVAWFLIRRHSKIKIQGIPKKKIIVGKFTFFYLFK